MKLTVLSILFKGSSRITETMLLGLDKSDFEVVSLSISTRWDINGDEFTIPAEVDLIVVNAGYPLDLLDSDQKINGSHPLVVACEKVMSVLPKRVPVFYYSNSGKSLRDFGVEQVPDKTIFMNTGMRDDLVARILQHHQAHR